MAGQPIKYNTGSKTTNCCITKNNFDIGVVSDYQYGPTNNTDFWAGYDIPAGGFVTYQNKVSQGPSIYEIPSVDDIWKFGTQLNIGPVVPYANQYVIRVASNLNDLLLVNVNYPELPQINNNILTLDAGYTPSYGWSAEDWFDVAGGTVTQATLTGLTTFITGSSSYNYSDSYVNMLADSQNAMALAPAFSSALQTFTVNVWFKLSTGGGYSNKQNVVGQQFSTETNYSPKDDCNFLIRGNGSNGFEGLIRVSNNDYVVDFGIVSAGGWVNLTLVYDGAELKTYLNGGPKNSTAVSGTLVSNGLQTIIGGTTNAYINSGGGVADYLDAGFGVVNIWNVALNEAEVNDLYAAYAAQRNY